MIKSIDHERFINKDDILSIVIGCLGHDIDHPGMNNGYLVKIRDSLAGIYNDKSVLENMHSSSLFKILDIDECNILKHFSSERRNYIKSAWTEAILGTDMSQHFTMWGKLKTIEEYDKNDAQNRKFVTSMIVHACDLSNSLYEFDHYIWWAVRLSQEFSDQYEAEEKLDEAEHGTPPDMLKYTNELGFYKSHISFINFIITPMWEQLYAFLKFDKVIMDNLTENIKLLNQKVEELEKP
jgi:hypothetical protein